MVKGIPPKSQFSRPSIDLGAKKREWREVPVNTIRVGDMVIDMGKIESVELFRVQGGFLEPNLQVRITNISKEIFAFDAKYDINAPEESAWVFPTVRAFVEVE
jgi:hypothetical protein